MVTPEQILAAIQKAGKPLTAQEIVDVRARQGAIGASGGCLIKVWRARCRDAARQDIDGPDSGVKRPLCSWSAMTAVVSSSIGLDCFSAGRLAVSVGRSTAEGPIPSI
jgi:hypothetical protein